MSLFTNRKDAPNGYVKYRKVKPRDLIKLDVESLSSLFPYRMYSQEDKTYINHKSVMQIFELPMLCGADEGIINDLVSSLNKHIKSDLYVRFFRMTHHAFGERIDEICAEYGKQGGIYEKLAQKQREYLNYVLAHGYPNNLNQDIPLLDSRLFFELSLKSNANNQDRKIAELSAITTELSVDFNTFGLPLYALPETELLAIIRFFVNFNEKQYYLDRQYNELETLDKQITAPGREYYLKDDSFMQLENNDIDDPDAICTTSYTIAKYPAERSLWQNGDFLALIEKPNAVTCPHIFSVAFKICNHGASERRAGNKKRSLTKSANSPLVNFLPTLRDQANEWDRVYQGLVRDEIELANMVINVSLFSSRAKHAKSCSHFEATMLSNGFEVRATLNMQLPLFLANLPGMMAEGYWEDLKKIGAHKTVTTFNLVNLLPMVGDFKGTNTGLLLPGMRNQIAAIDPFSPQMGLDNYNICVAGGSGSGKSFLVQLLIIRTLSQGGFVFVIDKGESYKKLCKTLGGIYLDAKNLQLNPFTFLDQCPDEESLNSSFEMIAELLATLAKPDEEMDGESKSYLLKASFLAYQKHKDNTNIDHVIDALGEMAKAFKERTGQSDMRYYGLISLLEKFATTGLHKQIFNKASQLDPNAKFVVMELNGLHENVLRPVLLSLINRVSQHMYFSDRNVKKKCIIDEAWALLSGDNSKAASFIETGFRTARRHNGSYVTISQAVIDYFTNPYAEACWNSSDTKLILRQNKKAFAKFVHDYPEMFNSYEQKVLGQFKEAKKAGFSSVMIQAGTNTTFHRAFADPWLRITVSSAGDHFQMVEDLQAKHQYTLFEATDKTARYFFGDEIKAIEDFNRTLTGADSESEAA